MIRYPSLALRVSILLVFTTPAFAQTPGIDPPLVGRPDGFSNIVGKYEIQVSAQPTEVHVEEPITLRIRIIGAGPAKYEPDRKHLDLFPNWGDDFYVQEMRDENRVERDQKTWLFVYRLKPKHAKVSAIDGIKLIYYDPSIARKNKFVTVPTEPIKITVKPKLAELDIETPLAVPDSFYERAASAEVLAPSLPPVMLSGGVLMMVILGVPCVCLIGAFAWRRFHPDERRLRDQRRSQAAQRALAELRSGTESPWSIVCRYLHERLNFASQDATPREVARFLKRRGYALERCAQAEAYLQACDAVQFTGNAAMDANSLAAEATNLIQTLEADPCAR
jgi:hypothetical protein